MMILFAVFIFSSISINITLALGHRSQCRNLMKIMKKYRVAFFTYRTPIAERAHEHLEFCFDHRDRFVIRDNRGYELIGNYYNASKSALSKALAKSKFDMRNLIFRFDYC